MNNVYIANFGRQNYEWSECLRKSTVATMNTLEAHYAWMGNDREAFYEASILPANLFEDKEPIPAVVTRWFNATTIINETERDIWLHRDQNHLWWTESKDAACERYKIQEPDFLGSRTLYVYHKPCLAWTTKTRKGRPLNWQTLHPKAKHFMFTEGTLAALSTENAEYVRALIDDVDLSPWHNLTSWLEAEVKAKVVKGTSMTALERSCFGMAYRAVETAKHSNGQLALKTVKDKQISISLEDLRELAAHLYHAQEGLCALTGLTLQLDGEQEDDNFLCSLDRIDSDGHYDRKNLQIVCRFANFWKSNQDNEVFKRLIGIIKSQ